ncbi:hypothetical protein C8R43DRAFT_1147738 [Mycena crocata]|nr:hypothetical protein C8R43DRAFT_1147738 [Mycena crocata]
MPPQKKRNPNKSHLSQGDIVKEDRPLKTGVETHIRLLSGVLKAADIPPMPTAELMANFESRFGPEDKLEELQAKLRKAPSHPDGMAMVHAIRNTAQTHTSITANNIRRVKDNFLIAIFSAVLTAGLQKWCPDVLGAPDSLYNRVHQMVALETFQMVVAAFGYSHLSIDRTRVRNIILLNSLYENFVFSYWADLARGELRKPGSVAKKVTDNNVYRRRDSLFLHRKDFLVKERFPPRAVRVVGDVECHSDDEGPFPDPAGHRLPIYHINDKNPRNTYMTGFYRDLDTKRFNAADGLGKSQYLITERQRRYIPAHAKSSDISRRFPPNATVDWFEPAYFNNLPLSIRGLYRNDGVALPLPSHWDEDWRSLSDEAFMEQYGNEVLELYNLPTDSDMEDAEDNEMEG